VVEEGWATYGVTAEIAAGVQERCFDYLDAPIRRLGGAQVPMPYSLPLEKASIPTSEDIKKLAREVVGRKHGDACHKNADAPRPRHRSPPPPSLPDRPKAATGRQRPKSRHRPSPGDWLQSSASTWPTSRAAAPRAASSRKTWRPPQQGNLLLRGRPPPLHLAP